MKHKDFGKAILSVIFLVTISIFCMTQCRDLWHTTQNNFTVPEKMKSGLINLNGAMAKRLHMRGYYSDLGIYITDDLYIISKMDETSTDYEYQKTCQLKEFLDQEDINLLYVNAPVKYLDDSIFEDNFGLTNYSNQNADKFLSRISEAGIDTLDLRDEIKKEHMDVETMFYRTDHHWTAKSGLWATRQIAAVLNEKCGYHIDMGLYDDSQYNFTEYQNVWLGEQGRKIALSYVGLDDYTLIEPKFETNLTLYCKDEKQKGTFDILLDKTRLSSDADAYNRPSLHYTYLPNAGTSAEIQNHNEKKSGNILLLSDSYSHVVAPFLSLGVSDLYMIVPRSYGGVMQFIQDNDIDTVVILYAQFMIGAHDDPESANYHQFNFDR